MSSPDGEHPPGAFRIYGILNKEENLKYAHVLVDMEMNITLRVIRRSWRVISTQGPIIRAIRYGVSTGQMRQVSVRNTADIKKLPRNPWRISGSDIL